MTNPQIFICIPVFNRIELTIECIKSIYKQTYKNFTVVICDDGSTDNTEETIRKSFPEVHILKGTGSLWWTGATNMCIKYAISLCNNCDFIYTLNNDTELFPDTLQNLYSRTTQMPMAIIGTVNLFYNDSKKIEVSAFRRRNRFPFREMFENIDKWGSLLEQRSNIIEVDTLSGKGVLIPISIFKNIGFFDQVNLPHYHADTEFIFRAKKNGYQVYLDYNSRLLSHQDKSGIGTRTSNPNIINFLKSFFKLKSTHHIKSLYHWHKLVFRKNPILHFIIAIMLILGGFIKRVLKF